MTIPTHKMPPSWLLGIIAVGMLLASGIYIGAIRAWGATSGRIVTAVLFGTAGALLVGMTAASARAAKANDNHDC